MHGLCLIVHTQMLTPTPWLTLGSHSYSYHVWLQSYSLVTAWRVHVWLCAHISVSKYLAIYLSFDSQLFEHVSNSNIDKSPLMAPWDWHMNECVCKWCVPFVCVCVCACAHACTYTSEILILGHSALMGYIKGHWEQHRSVEQKEQCQPPPNLFIHTHTGCHTHIY